MITNLAADVSALMADFGQTVTLDGASVTAIFDNAFALVDAGGDGPGLASSAPALTLPSASVPASPVGKAATVGATSYTVTAHHPDGAALSILILREA